MPLLNKIVLWWFALITVVFWLPTVRGPFDGASYEWAAFGFGGRGAGGDYWFPAVAALISVTLIAYGWSGRRWAFGVMTAWNVILLSAIVSVVTGPHDDYTIQGDSLGINISLDYVGPVLCGAASIATGLAAWRLPQRIGHGAIRINRTWLALLAGAIPIQFALLNLGTPGSPLDAAGVVLTTGQWLFTGRMFRHAADS